MTTNLNDKMLAAIDAYFSASDGDERDQAEEQLLDVRDELLKQPAQQEPVATLYGSLPVYDKPAQRTWVELTDEEFQWIYDNGRTPAGMMELTEAKLKEKNT